MSVETGRNLSHGPEPERAVPMNSIRPLSLSAFALAAFAMAAAPPAQAAWCVYGGGGASDSGPCMQFEGGGGVQFDLWCLQGYTSSSHKIIMKSKDSFTCKVTNTDADVAITILSNYSTRHRWSCGEVTTQKNIVEANRYGWYTHRCEK